MCEAHRALYVRYIRTHHLLLVAEILLETGFSEMAA